MTLFRIRSSPLLVTAALKKLVLRLGAFGCRAGAFLRARDIKRHLDSPALVAAEAGRLYEANEERSGKSNICREAAAPWTAACPMAVVPKVRRMIHQCYAKSSPVCSLWNLDSGTNTWIAMPGALPKFSPISR